MKTKKMKTDKQMILDPNLWPCWPFFPVKRKNNSLEDKNIGLLIETEEFQKGVIIVYHAYLFGLPKTKDEWE